MAFRKNHHATKHKVMSKKDTKSLKNTVLKTLPWIDMEVAFPKGVNFTKQTLGDGTVWAPQQDDPLFFALSRQRDQCSVFPTVYLLWKCPPPPSIVVQVPHPVSVYILRGADLMLPGIVSDLTGARKGSLCVLCVRGNPYPFAVGCFALSYDEMLLQGMKGKGVHILHAYRDLLFSSGSGRVPDSSSFQAHAVVPVEEKSQQVSSASESAGEDVPEPESIDVDNLSASEMNREVERQFLLAIAKVPDSALPLDAADLEKQAFPSSSAITVDSSSYETIHTLAKHFARRKVIQTTIKQGVQITSVDRRHKDFQRCICPPSTNDTFPDQEEALDEALGKSLANLVDDSMLPLPTSVLYSQFMKSIKGVHVDVKSTQFKKLSKYLHAKETEGVISLKEHKGELFVSKVFRDHVLLTRFAVEATQAASIQVPKPKSNSSPEISVPKVAVLYRLKHGASSSFLFEKFQPKNPDVFHGKHLYTQQDVKAAVHEYIAREERDLGGPYVRVEGDLKLQKLLSCDSRDVLKSSLIPSVLASMRKYFAIVLDDGTVHPKFKAGDPPQVIVEVKTLIGRKTATRIRGLAPYYVDVGTLASFARTKYACSVTVKQSDSDQYELQIQGNWSAQVRDVLATCYGIPRSFIVVKRSEKRKKKTGPSSSRA